MTRNTYAGVLDSQIGATERNRANLFTAQGHTTFPRKLERVMKSQKVRRSRGGIRPINLDTTRLFSHNVNNNLRVLSR